MSESAEVRKAYTDLAEAYINEDQDQADDALNNLKYVAMFEASPNDREGFVARIQTAAALAAMFSRTQSDMLGGVE